MVRRFFLVTKPCFLLQFEFMTISILPQETWGKNISLFVAVSHFEDLLTVFEQSYPSLPVDRSGFLTPWLLWWSPLGFATSPLANSSSTKCS